MEEDETKAKAQMESWQSVKDEKNVSHKAFFEKRDQLSGRISLLDKECYRLKVRSRSWKSTGNLRFPICGMSMRSPRTMPFSTKRRAERSESHEEEIAQVKDEIRKLGNVNDKCN